MSLNECLRKRWEAVGVAISGMIFNKEVLTFNISQLLKPLPQRVEIRGVRGLRDSFQYTDHIGVFRLRTRRERPSRHRPAESGYELPPSNADYHLPLPRLG
jgi:hypothetical protein